jgi:hypothetical protein
MKTHTGDRGALSGEVLGEDVKAQRGLAPVGVARCLVLNLAGYGAAGGDGAKAALAEVSPAIVAQANLPSHDLGRLSRLPVVDIVLPPNGFSLVSSIS